MTAFRAIQQFKNLYDLASRPVLLDLLVRTLPHLDEIERVNQASLYDKYTHELLIRRWSDKTDFMAPEERLYLMEELAWEMVLMQRSQIPFSEFPQRITRFFELENAEERS